MTYYSSDANKRGSVRLAHLQITAPSPFTLSSLKVFKCAMEDDRWPHLSFIFPQIFSPSPYRHHHQSFFLSILLFCILTVLTPRTSSTAYQSNNKPPTHPSHYRPLATTCIVGILIVGPDGVAQLAVTKTELVKLNLRA